MPLATAVARATPPASAAPETTASPARSLTKAEARLASYLPRRIRSSCEPYVTDAGETTGAIRCRDGALTVTLVGFEAEAAALWAPGDWEAARGCAGVEEAGGQWGQPYASGVHFGGYLSSCRERSRLIWTGLDWRLYGWVDGATITDAIAWFTKARPVGRTEPVWGWSPGGRLPTMRWAALDERARRPSFRTLTHRLDAYQDTLVRLRGRISWIELATTGIKVTRDGGGWTDELTLWSDTTMPVARGDIVEVIGFPFDEDGEPWVNVVQARRG